MKQIDLIISNNALERIREIVDLEDKEFVPGLIYAKAEMDDADGSPISRYEGWMVERYKREEIEAIEDCLCMIAGVEFFFFQKHLLEELEGRSLNYRDGHFLVK